MFQGLTHEKQKTPNRTQPLATPQWRHRALNFTFIGGGGNEASNAIVVGNSVVSVTGWTQSNGLATPGAFQTSRGGGVYDAFVARLNGTGGLFYFTYFGGSGNEAGNDIVINSAGVTYITGVTNSTNFPLVNPLPSPNRGLYDAFVARGALNGQGVADIAFSTVLGGEDNDAGLSIGVDGVSNVYVAGYSWSSNFRTVAGSFDTVHNGGVSDAVVFKLTP